MAKQLPQTEKRFPSDLLRTSEPAHDNVGGYHVWVPGQVDVLVSPVGLRGEPVGQQPRVADGLLGRGKALIRAGERSQKMLEERQQKEAEGEIK